VEREAELALDYLRPAFGATLVDMSCGSGLFARRFLASGRFAGVVAADFSESMLREARQNFERDAGVDPGQARLCLPARVPAAAQHVPHNLFTPSSCPSTLQPLHPAARRRGAPAVCGGQRGGGARGRRHPLLARPAGRGGRDLAGAAPRWRVRGQHLLDWGGPAGGGAGRRAGPPAARGERGAGWRRRRQHACSCAAPPPFECYAPRSSGGARRTHSPQLPSPSPAPHSCSWNPRAGLTGGGRRASCATCAPRWGCRASAGSGATGSSSSPRPSRRPADRAMQRLRRRRAAPACSCARCMEVRTWRSECQVVDALQCLLGISQDTLKELWVPTGQQRRASGVSAHARDVTPQERIRIEAPGTRDWMDGVTLNSDCPP
jgi:hypothetical protein